MIGTRSGWRRNVWKSKRGRKLHKNKKQKKVKSVWNGNRKHENHLKNGVKQLDLGDAVHNAAMHTLLVN